MEVTYEIAKDENKDILIEINTVEKRKSYEKEWLIKEIAKLQSLLDKFKEDK